MRRYVAALVVLLPACHDATAPRSPTCVGDRGSQFEATPVNLAAGEALVLTASASRSSCLSIAPIANSRYLITVFNVDTNGGAYTLLEFRGKSPDATGSARITQNLEPSGGAAALHARLAGVDPGTAAGMELHTRLLSVDRALVRRRGGPRAIERRARLARTAVLQRSARAGRPAAMVAVNDTASFRIRDIRSDRDCTKSYTAHARAVYSGEHALIYEDLASPLAGTMDDTFRRLGAEFDSYTYGLLLQYFGDPLAYDAHLGGKGRVEMLFSPVLNTQFAGVAGFVSACDFFPFDTAAGPDQDLVTNEAAIFYAYLPSSAADLSQWQSYIRGVLAHEAKHLASYAAHLANGAIDFEQEWLEESTAQAAAEIYQRAYSGSTWKGDARFAGTVGCEPPLTVVNNCTGDHPQVMAQHFAFLYDYLYDPSGDSPISGTSLSDYGGAWSFVRWALDQYAPSEDGALRAMTQSVARTGIANLSLATGAPFPEMLAGWTLASALPGYPDVAPPSAAYTMPSWDHADIFLGMHNELYLSGGPAFPRRFPLRAGQLRFGGIDGVEALRGGGAVYLELRSLTAMREFIQILDPATGALLSGGPIRVAIMRLE